MAEKTKIFLAIFLLAAVIGSIFIYFNCGQIDQMVNNYIAEIADCRNILSEADCYAKDFCEGIYGPGCAGCQGLEFKYCQRIPDQVLVQLDKEKSLCMNTGGEWYHNHLGNFCLCESNGDEKFFNKDEGCIKKPK